MAPCCCRRASGSAASLLLALLLALLALARVPQGARAHGFMMEPGSRNYLHSTYIPRTLAQTNDIEATLGDAWFDYCPHCLAAGGPGRVSNLSEFTWPLGLHGLCGDMYYVGGNAPDGVDTQRPHEAGGQYATGAVGVGVGGGM